MPHNSPPRNWRRPSIDGRWYCVGIVVIYFAALALSGPIETMRARWKHAGLHATGPTFLDLRLFPAARAEFAAGGNPYVLNPQDPDKRPYNYPRLWLFFLRFSAEDSSVTVAGIVLALFALFSILFYWGPMQLYEGMYAGLLLCTPAIMLGVEKGNTDLFILAMMALGLRALANDSPGRVALCSTTFLVTAALKLFPAFALFALPARTFRGWLKITGLSLTIFLVYLIVTRDEISASVRNTFAGPWWIQTYGARVPIIALNMFRSYYGYTPLNVAGWSLFATGIAAATFAAAAAWGWKRGHGRPSEPVSATLGALTGFRSAALIYCATYLAGANFDYRQCFLLLALPQLFQWSRSAEVHRRPAIFTLTALLFSCGTNWVMAGWPGFFLNEVAGLLLGCGLTALFACTWARSTRVQAHAHAH